MPVPAQDNLDSPFLNRAALASLRHLCFAPRPRAVAEGVVVGRHRSRRHGGAAEFVDYRSYVPGDDLRRLDWKVLARSGRPFIRRHEDESSLHVTLMLDASNSMNFDASSDLTKLVYAQFVASALAELIMRQQDEAGVLIPSEKPAYVRPGRSATHAHQLHRTIAEIQPTGATQLEASLRQLREATRGTLLLLSDFLVDDLESLFGQLRTLRAGRWTILLLHILHPSEEHLPSGVAWRFEGLEDDGVIDCSPLVVAEGYERRFFAHAEEVRRRAIACGCDYRRVSTTVPWLDTVRSYLVPRGG